FVVPNSGKLPDRTISSSVNRPAGAPANVNAPPAPVRMVELYGIGPLDVNVMSPATGWPAESRAMPDTVPTPFNEIVTFTVPPAGTSAVVRARSTLPRTSTVSVAMPAATRSNAKRPSSSVVVENDPPPVPPTSTKTTEGGAAVAPSGATTLPSTRPDARSATSSD